MHPADVQGADSPLRVGSGGEVPPELASEQFLNGASAHYRLFSAIKLEITKLSES